MFMAKSKFEFYTGDLLGLVLFFIVFKIVAVVGAILLIFAHLSSSDALSFGNVLGLAAGVWAFYKLHRYYKKKKLAKANTKA